MFFVYKLYFCEQKTDKMELVKTLAELQSLLASYKEQNKSIGFVPTMGALHEGHLSLIKYSKEKTDITVCSIFVNPTQFNDKKDFDKYPQTPEQDLKMLEAVNCDLVFMPSYEDVYGEDMQDNFTFGSLETVMEGAFRPGHFAGVAQVVSRLFRMVQPDFAFFGQKDFQQYVIIKDLVRQMQVPIQIEACPIIREKSGLAMSSRNQRLSDKEKQEAAKIYQSLAQAQELVHQKTPQELKKWVENQIEKSEGLKLEYFDIVDDKSLQSVSSWQDKGKKVGCIAVFCGNVRLIDNIVFIL